MGTPTRILNHVLLPHSLRSQMTNETRGECQRGAAGTLLLVSPCVLTGAAPIFKHRFIDSNPSPQHQQQLSTLISRNTANDNRTQEKPQCW